MAKGQTEEGRGPWFVISAAVVALVVVAALVLTAVNVFGGSEDSQAKPKGEGSSSKSENESVCGLKPGKSSETTLTSAPPKTEWRLVDRMAAPKVEGSGPGKIEDDQFGYCFAQSPTGAVVAAANIGASTNSSERQVKTYDKLAVPGPGRDKILKSLKQGDPGTGAPEGVSVQIAGFKVQRYSAKEATVDLAVEVDGESYMSAPMDLRWVDGDWKVVVNDDGTVYDSQPLSDLSGYVIWSGA